MNNDGELILYYGTANSADVVAIDDEIIGWLARHERHVDCGERRASAKTDRSGRGVAWRSDMRRYCIADATAKSIDITCV
jgi:hypothetical protein